MEEGGEIAEHPKWRGICSPEEEAADWQRRCDIYINSYQRATRSTTLEALLSRLAPVRARKGWISQALAYCQERGAPVAVTRWLCTELEAAERDVSSIEGPLYPVSRFEILCRLLRQKHPDVWV